MIKGYARVSTDGQDLATQHELLKAAGAELVYSEKQSGIKTDRAALARCIASPEPGDTVVVTKLDRFARSTRDLLNTLGTIGEAGASFRSLGGRVEMWRGGCRLNISVSAPFVRRCLSGSTVTPFPHPAHRTGQADFPHPALGQELTPSPTARCAQARSGVRARSARKDAEVDRSRACVA